MNLSLFSDAIKSFGALDDMASKDEYIHSEGLNVNKSHDMDKVNSKKKMVLAVHSSKESVAATDKNTAIETQQMNTHLDQSTTQINNNTNHSNFMLLESVAQVINHPILTISSQKKTISSSTPNMSKFNTLKKVDKDDLNEDPIWNGMNGMEQRPILQSTQDDVNNDMTHKSSTINKDPHRFFKDLDARMSKEVQVSKNQTTPLHQEIQQDDHYHFLKDKPLTFLSRLGHSMASMINLPSNLLSSTSAVGHTHTKDIEMEPLNHSKNPTSRLDEEMAVQVSSSAVLRDGETEELLRIQHRSTDIVALLKDYLVMEWNQKYLFYFGFLFVIYIWFRS